MTTAQVSQSGTEPQIAFRALSLGAGVQSTVLALLLSRGNRRLRKLGYRKPDAAIFADTGWEPDYVYRHLDWLEQELSYPLIRVSAGDLSENLPRARTATGHRFVDVPLFTVNPDGKKGMLRRQCTNHYKVTPITKEVRELAGGKRGRPFPKGKRVEMWLGISTDEVLRMKPSREPWIDHRWPLIDLEMSRDDCHDWFERTYPDRHLPRSACVICPYRSDAHWLELKEAEPESYAQAVEFDRWLRRRTTNPIRRLIDGRPYLHSARRPLGTIIAERAEANGRDPDQFDAECEGMCGV